MTDQTLLVQTFTPVISPLLTQWVKVGFNKVFANVKISPLYLPLISTALGYGVFKFSQLAGLYAGNALYGFAYGAAGVCVFELINTFSTKYSTVIPVIAKTEDEKIEQGISSGSSSSSSSSTYYPNPSSSTVYKSSSSSWKSSSNSAGNSGFSGVSSSSSAKPLPHVSSSSSSNQNEQGHSGVSSSSSSSPVETHVSSSSLSSNQNGHSGVNVEIANTETVINESSSSSSSEESHLIWSEKNQVWVPRY